MNKYPFLLLAIAFLSCKSEKSNQELTSTGFRFSYTIDTVIIDAGDDFLFLKYDLMDSDISDDERLFINIDQLGNKIEIIDLDNHILKEKISFEREGPNGVGPEHISKFQLLENGNLCFYNIHKFTILTPDLQKILSQYFYPEAFEGDTLPEKAEIEPFYSNLNQEGSKFAGFYDLFFENKTLGIALIDLETKRLKLIPTDKLDYLKELIYTTVFENGSKINSGDAKSIDFFEEKLIISTSAKNEVLVYDIAKDSLWTKSYHSKFLSNIKQGNYKAESNSDLALKIKDQEVYFNKLAYDKTSKLFWRYSRESKTTNPESPSFEYVLTAFDQDLNQIHEEELDVDWTHKPSIKFIKNGMLYTYINLEDEMAFIRLKPNFEND